LPAFIEAKTTEQALIQPQARSCAFGGVLAEVS